MSTAIQFKASLFPLTILQLYTTDIEKITQALSIEIEQHPQFFNHTAIVIDLSAVSNAPLSLSKIKTTLRSKQLLPVAIQHGSAEQHLEALQAGLAIFSGSKQQAPEPQSHTESSNPMGTWHDQPIRSGQQIKNMQGDLLIGHRVSRGGEAIASGNITVFGTLAGKAFAGLPHQKHAKILCQALEAELIAIAGVHWREGDYPSVTPGPQGFILIELDHHEKLQARGF